MVLSDTMNKLKLFASGFTALFLMLIPVKIASAGGALFSVMPDGNSDTNNNGANIRVVRVFLHPEWPCKGTEITLKFVEPKEGDFINVGSENQPYVIQEDRQPNYKDGVMGTTCGTYAKVGSKFVGDRLFTVTVKNKETQTSSIVLHMDGKNYGGMAEDPYWSMTTDEWKKNNPLPTANPATAAMPGVPEMVYPSDGQVLGIDGAYMFKVKPVNNASGYLFGFFQNNDMIYENYRDNRTLSSNGEFAVWESNTFHNKFKLGKVKVLIRALVNNQWTDAREITIILAPGGGTNTNTQTAATRASIQQVTETAGPATREQFVTEQKPPVIKPSQKIVVVTDSSVSAALQQRINALEKKLIESERRQSVLETQLNQLVSWIKSVFPFFK